GGCDIRRVLSTATVRAVTTSAIRGKDGSARRLSLHSGRPHKRKQQDEDRKIPSPPCSQLESTPHALKQELQRYLHDARLVVTRGNDIAKITLASIVDDSLRVLKRELSVVEDVKRLRAELQLRFFRNDEALQ